MKNRRDPEYGKRTLLQKRVMQVCFPASVLLPGIAGGVSWLLGPGPPTPTNDGVVPVWFYFVMAGVVLFFIAVIAAFLPLYERCSQQIDTALAPLPSPPELTAELTRQLGRAPTLEEVQFIYWWLTQERSQARVELAALGGVLAAAHFIGK